MGNRVAILLIWPLVLVFAPFCSAQGDESTQGKSATGKISWEIRPPADNRASSTIWLWPDDQKDKATQLTETPTFNQIAFSADDAWEKITAGASLLQIYTALVYEGPGLAKKIVTGLRDKMEKTGCKHLREAVGSAK